MSPDAVFGLCNAIAMIGWIILLFISPFVFNYEKFVIGIIVTLFGIVYTWFIFSSFSPGDMKSFGSLDGVMKLFENKTLVTAGWVHYLAFDLVTGIWIQKNAQKHMINHWITVPCLLFTFMLGPFGLLLYLGIRWIKTKRYFAENY